MYLLVVLELFSDFALENNWIKMCTVVAKFSKIYLNHFRELVTSNNQIMNNYRNNINTENFNLRNKCFLQQNRYLRIQLWTDIEMLDPECKQKTNFY